MLVRAAKRKVHLDVSRARLSCEQLYLPWLCPAYNVPQRAHRRAITVDTTPQITGPGKRRNSNDALTTAPRRSLATAASQPSNDIPFVGIHPSMLSSSPSQPSSSEYLSYFENRPPVVLGGSLATPPKRYRFSKEGIGGDQFEMLSIFKACLAVGRIERAGIILKRVIKIDTTLTEDEVIALHNEFLRGATSHNKENSSSSGEYDLHKWFELEIRSAGVPINAYTLGYMLQASLQNRSDDWLRRERLVRRYMDIARSSKLELEVLNLDEMFTAREISEISRYCAEYGVQVQDKLAADSENEEHRELEEIGQTAGSSEEGPTAVVRPVEQKGLGLKSLRATLSSLVHNREEPDRPISNDPDERRKAQLILESSAVTSAIERWRDENESLTKMGLNTSLQTKSLGARMWGWQVALEAAIKEELVKIDQAELMEKKQEAETERCVYGPFLRLLPPDQLAAVTILSCMSSMTSLGLDKGVPLALVIMAIAENVEDEALYDKVQKSSKKPSWIRSQKDDKKRITPAILRSAKRARTSGYNNPGLGDLSKSDVLREVLTSEVWPAFIRVKVGARLMSALMETAKIPVTMQHQETGELVTQMQPAFSHSQQFRQGKKIGVVIANRVLTNQLKREPVHSLLAKHLPMLVQPDPWTKFNKGGFLSHPAKVLRIKLGDKDQRHYAEAAISNGDMERTFKGLDVLGRTSWRINKPLFNIMLEAWNSGEPLANLAPLTPTIPVPSEPSSSQDPMARKNWIRAVRHAEHTKSGLHSQRCFQNFQLEIARSLRNETFYFPHNVDFRGRAYPIPPYLNHMGADHCRGLLMFGEGRELGESGLRWLKIHLANVFGYDKASLKEREDFATKHISKIFDSVTDPLGGNKWWLNAEDPWQFLAACIELKNALDSPDPTKFISHLPIHQDGTCNGLQHYAALGGDTWGAKQVNLEPGDRPADVYTAVANLVKESIAADKKEGNHVAEALDGRVTRKIVKQTVMTNVYGVTYVGAKAQVRKALVGMYKDLPNEEHLHPGILSAYIATKIFTALASMFRGAHDIQYWLGECANRISLCVTPEQMDSWKHDLSSNSTAAPVVSFDHAEQFKSSVIWTNPLNMPIVQPYRSAKTRGIHTHMQRISLSEPHRSNPISKRKQLQGFPPNFIHSLDATHMLLSALRCDELGLSFAAVHDSFWTHASDVDTMNEVLRDTFIKIHTEDVIGRLAAEFAARYRGCFYLARVRHDTPLYAKIAALRQARGDKPAVRQLNDLGLERERWTLLNSKDPKEVKKGREMVTAGSLYEKHGTEGDLVQEDTLASYGIGEISAKEAKLARDLDSQLAGAANYENVHNPNDTSNDMSTEFEDVPASEASDISDEDSLTPFERHVTSKKKASSTTLQTQKSGWVWLPLTFPPVPKKGEFDVTRLRDSTYFFS